MRIDPDVTIPAFEAYRDRYAERTRQAWELDHHVALWATARRAFDAGEVAAFEELYAELRKYWQITRGKGATHARPAEVFNVLCALPAALRQKRLSAHHEADAPDLLRLVESIACIKRTKDGRSSIMAISKILHFYNPRLFVIVDRAAVWDWTLNHTWIWRPIEAARERLREALGPEACRGGDGSACDPVSYVAILLWSAQLLRDNPHVMLTFDTFLRANCKSVPLPADLAAHEAAAVEWLLLGLVELPPPGVSFDGSVPC